MPETPTTQINFPQQPHSPDHDLLLTFKAEVSTKLDRVISDVKDLKDDLASRVSGLESEKMSKEDFEEFKTTVVSIQQDQELRIRSNTKCIQYGLGFSSAVQTFLIIYQIYKSFHP